MQLRGIIIFVFFITLYSFSFEDFGSLKQARRNYPEIFVPGSVHKVAVNGVSSYVFSGQSEQYFTGEHAESESELYDEATLSAKSTFFSHLTKNDSKIQVEIKGCQVLYRYNDKKVYTIILFVPESNVKLKLAESEGESKKSVVQTSEKTVLKNQEEITSRKAVENTRTNDLQENRKASPKQEGNAIASKPQTIPVAQSQNDEKHHDGNVPDDTVMTSAERRILKFQKRLEKSPDDLITHVMLGEAQQKNGNFTAAIASFLNAIRLFENNDCLDESEKNKIISVAAELCEAQGNYGLAIKCYYALLKRRCSESCRRKATSGISRLRLKVLN